ncbi:GDSL-type esterase/lipase family protein [Vibrio mimicus]|uniref:SGNH/GDSL hydrolase family protein n=1 Tax=Vibrio mimicus TaxID=674 RepID=UPI002F935D94
MLKRLSCLGALLVSATSMADTVPATHYALQYEGRHINDYAAGTVKMNWPGSSVKTRLVGTELSVSLLGKGDRFDVLVDGQLHQTIVTNVGNTPQTFTLYQQAQPNPVVIELVKRTENYTELSQFISFDYQGYLEGEWRREPHILFIGDSISAGFASESNKRDCTYDEIVVTSNARLAFPYKTSQALQASLTQVSFSGLGLVRNWDGNQSYHTLADYLDKPAAIYGFTADFEDKHPDLIVIEVGTNDFSTPPQPHEPWTTVEEVKNAWVSKMVDVVTALRHRYGMTNIVLMPRPDYPYYQINPATAEAIALLNQAGQKGVYSMNFVSPFEGCIWHPTATEHQAIADQLANFITENQLL